jgi:four helix bundle protein
MAQGSLAELETQLEIAARLRYVSREQQDQLLPVTTSLGKQLWTLRRALAEKIEE